MGRQSFGWDYLGRVNYIMLMILQTLMEAQARAGAESIKNIRAICKTIFSPKLCVMLKILSSEFNIGS